MSLKKIIVLLAIALSMFSCKTYKLSKSDLEWQPYKVGDKLVFKSNKDEMDTIQIKSVEIHNAENDPLALFPSILQSLYVIDNKREILELSSSKPGSNILFSIKLGKNNLKYPSTILSIKEMSILETKNGKYIIEATEFYDNMKDVSFDLRYIYWSKEFGYLGIEYSDNYIWTLKSFIRDGEEIFDTTMVKHQQNR